MSKGRLEAFSDGVIAIIITIMVLELHVPHGAELGALRPLLPKLLAYAYAQGDSITFAANTEGGPFGLSPATLLGMPNALEMQNIIEPGLKNQK